MAELIEKFDVHPNKVTGWKQQLLENADQLFGRGEKQAGQARGTRSTPNLLRGIDANRPNQVFILTSPVFQWPKFFYLNSDHGLV